MEEENTYSYKRKAKSPYSPLLGDVCLVNMPVKIKLRMDDKIPVYKEAADENGELYLTYEIIGYRSALCYDVMPQSGEYYPELNAAFLYDVSGNFLAKG